MHRSSRKKRKNSTIHPTRNSRTNFDCLSCACSDGREASPGRPGDRLVQNPCGWCQAASHLWHFQPLGEIWSPQTPIAWPPDVKSRLSLKKTLMLIEGRRRGRQRMRWLDSTDSTDTGLNKLWEVVKDREAWPAAVHESAVSAHFLKNFCQPNFPGPSNAVLISYCRCKKLPQTSWLRITQM